MYYAQIELTRKNHTKTESGYLFHTLYGKVFVPAEEVKTESNIALVPALTFAKQGANPCMVVNGFIGHIEV